MSESALRESIKNLCDDPKCCRERLLHAAGTLFAEHGLDGVSTRELTDAAGVNLASIAYYFGGKDGLRDAVLDYVIEKSAVSGSGPVYARLAGDVAAAGSDRKALADAARRFVRGFLSTTLPQDHANWWVTVINRAMSGKGSAHDRIYGAVVRPGFEAVSRLVAALEGKSVEDRKVRLLATLVLGEVLSFRRSRAIVLRELGWQDFSPTDIDRIVSMVSERVLARLNLSEFSEPSPVAA